MSIFKTNVLGKIRLTSSTEKSIRHSTSLLGYMFDSDSFRKVNALELDRKRYAYKIKKRIIMCSYEERPISKKLFEHIQELRIYRQPDDLKIYDEVFGNDIKRIFIWDKGIPEKYCDIQKSRNSLEEVYIYSRSGFSHLSIISPSCKKLEVQFFKLQNIKNVALNTIFPSVEHLIVNEGYNGHGELNPTTVKEFIEFIAKVFPNLKQLDMDIDYLNYKAFNKTEVIKLDPKMFDSLSPEVKGTIKFETFKILDIFKKSVEIVKDDRSLIVDQSRIFEKFEIHDGLTFESSVSFCDDVVVDYHKFFGLKDSPAGPFWFQHVFHDENEKFSDRILSE